MQHFHSSTSIAPPAGVLPPDGDPRPRQLNYQGAKIAERIEGRRWGIDYGVGAKSADRFLNIELQNMAKLSDKYFNRLADLRYISPDALNKDGLNKRITACGRSLRSVVANGQFVDDGSCG